MSGVSASEVLYAHMHGSDVSRSAMQQRVAVLEAIVARSLQQAPPALHWDVSTRTTSGNGTTTVWTYLKAAGYSITSNTAGYNCLQGNGLDVEAKDVEQLKQIALNHLHCKLTASALVGVTDTTEDKT